MLRGAQGFAVHSECLCIWLCTLTESTAPCAGNHWPWVSGWIFLPLGYGGQTAKTSLCGPFLSLLGVRGDLLQPSLASEGTYTKYQWHQLLWGWRRASRWSPLILAYPCRFPSLSQLCFWEDHALKNIVFLIIPSSLTVLCCWLGYKPKTSPVAPMRTSDTRHCLSSRLLSIDLRATAKIKTISLPHQSR